MLAAKRTQESRLASRRMFGTIVVGTVMSVVPACGGTIGLGAAELGNDGNQHPPLALAIEPARLPAHQALAELTRRRSGDPPQLDHGDIPVERRLGPSPGVAAIEATIADIATSELMFIVPELDVQLARMGERRMAGPAFAGRLRQKWRWLGADLDEREAWIAEIATHSFPERKPYHVETLDGRRVPLAQWLAGRAGPERR